MAGPLAAPSVPAPPSLAGPQPLAPSTSIHVAHAALMHPAYTLRRTAASIVGARRIRAPGDIPAGVHLGLMALWALGSGPAVPEPVEWLALTWSAPEGCPTADDVRQDVGWLLGSGSVASTVRAAATVVAVDADDSFDLNVTLDIDGVRHPRQLTAPNCADLGRATALLIAVLVDPVTSGRQAIRAAAAAPEPVQPPATPMPPVLREVPVPPPQAETPTPAPEAPGPREPGPAAARWKGVGRLGMGAAVGVLPAAGFAIEGALGAQLRWFRAEAGVVYRTPRQVPHPTAEDVDGNFQMVSGTARACGVPGRPGLAIPLCLETEVGGIRGEGSGPAVQSPNPGWAPWAGIGVSAALAWMRTPNLGFWIGAAGLASLVRPTFVVGDVPGPAHQPGPIVGRFSAGITLKFGSRTSGRRGTQG